mgnify:FL=1
MAAPSSPAIDSGSPSLVGTIARLFSKDGVSAKGPYTKHGIMIGDLWVNHFSMSAQAQAKAAKDRDEVVEAFYDENKHGKNLSFLRTSTGTFEAR